MNRYLAPGGARIDSRFLASLRIFWALYASVVVLVVLVASHASIDAAPFVIAMAVAAVALIGSVVYACVLLLRVARRLEGVTRLWLAGDTERAVLEAQAAFPIAFRADFRTRAYHALGLSAEAHGDFGEALELFRLAEASLPTAAAPVRKERARVLVRCHQAMALSALGDLAGAEGAQRGALQAYAELDRPRLTNMFLDDASWGLGAASLNYVLEGMEGGRDPRALLSLSGMRVAALAAAHREVLGIAERERTVLMAGLLPRERLLAQRVEEAARLAVEPHYRSAPVVADVDPRLAAWVEAALGRAPRPT